MTPPLHTRRRFVAGAGAVLAGVLAPPALAKPVSRRRARAFALADVAQPDAHQRAALRVLGRSSFRLPGSLPHPHLAAGADTLPQVEHVVVVMMENHSYDNLFGMLGRGPYQRPRGDGFTIASDGYPANTNPQADGTPLRAFHMPTSCQLHGKPSQEWAASHQQYDAGRLDGFVTSPSGPVAMGYWTDDDIPFTLDLAAKFPIGDRWFCSLLGQTDPNRRFLIAGTAAGMTDDIGTSANGASQNALLGVPAPKGTIFTALSSHGIPWADYAVGYPGATSESPNLYPADDSALLQTHAKPFSQFLSDAAAGTLPSFSLVEPNYSTQSQEDPQNIVLGDAFLESTIRAVGNGPKWRQTLLILTYDEHGGYYDHVPPPIALAPDDIAPVVRPGESVYDGFKRYGFRVPSVVVSPYAKPGHVSHVVYDHTSILALVERKWNLPALSLRDANANDLSDFLDLKAMAAGTPTFPKLPVLHASGDTPAAERCSTSGPGIVPPPRPKPLPIGARINKLAASRHPRGVVAELQASRGGLHGVSVELWHRGRRLAHHKLNALGVPERRLLLRVAGHGRLTGAYEVIVRHGGHVLAHRTVTLR